MKLASLLIGRGACKHIITRPFTDKYSPVYAVSYPILIPSQSELGLRWSSLLFLVEDHQVDSAQQPFFGAMGCTSAIVFTCFGAAYGTAKSGVGISAMGVLRPDLIVKSTLPNLRH